MNARGGLWLLIGGLACAVGAVVLLFVIDEASLWSFALFALGTVAALVGVARLAHARNQRRRSLSEQPDDDRAAR